MDNQTLFAALEFFDYIVIGIMITVLTSGTAIASRRSGANAAAGERLRRVEDKLNVLLEHNNIVYVPQSKERWQELAESNVQEEAAKEYVETYSVTLQEAQDVVEQYLEDRSKSGRL